MELQVLFLWLHIDFDLFDLMNKWPERTATEID
jgi:hypothetical protein